RMPSSTRFAPACKRLSRSCGRSRRAGREVITPLVPRFSRLRPASRLLFGTFASHARAAMAYFRNSTVNLLNLHYGIHCLALGGGGAFFLVFLLQSGVPAPGVLASLATILLGRFIVRPSVLVVARRVGLKPLVIAGTIAIGLEYPLLAEVHGVGPALF